MAEIEKELTALPRGRRRAPRSAGVVARDARGDGRPEVLRPARHLAARDAAARLARRGRVRRGARLRRLVDPRLAGDRGERHDPHAGRRRGDPRSVHRGADALAPLRDRGARDARAVQQGSAPGRKARGGLSALDRHRRHVLRRPRVRVLRLRRGLVHERAERGALQGRLVRGPLELRRSRPRLHDPREAGLLPARAARHAERPAHAHGDDARAARRAVRVPPSRGRFGGPVRDRPALPEPHAHGRSGAALQVRDQERGARRRKVGDVHAEADLR